MRKSLSWNYFFGRCLVMLKQTAPAAKQNARKSRRTQRHSTCCELLEAREVLSSSSMLATVQWAGAQRTAVAGEWIVKLNDVTGGGQSQVNTAQQRLDRVFGKDVSAVRSLSRDGMTLVRQSANCNRSLADMDNAFQRVQGLAYAEPNFILHAATTPNDTRFGSMWGLNNSGQSIQGVTGVADADIDAPEAWAITTGSRNVVVGVIDTGVDYNHPDLLANIWTNPGEIAGNNVDDDSNGYVDDVHGYDFANNDADPFDDNGHGTHAAGTIAASGNNGTGSTGVSWSSQIMALKFLDATGSGSLSAAVSALNYATMMKNRGVNVVLTSNSWGGGGYSQALFNAIQSSANANMLFVAAAGNESNNNDTNLSYPASYNLPNVISVAATDNRDGLASFSNYGATQVDLGAPGVNTLSTIPGNGYAYYSGTSMATPHVSGVAALAWSLKPTATVAEVRNALLTGVDPVASLAGKTVTGGRLNAFRTLQILSSANPVNDNFGSSLTLVGNSVQAIGSNARATKEVGEPNHAGNVGGTSVWWSWTASTTGSVTIDTVGSNFNTLLGVYQGAVVGSLTAIASNDDAVGTQSRVSFNATAGQTYRIAIDGFGAVTGSVVLNVAATVVGPANDNFAAANSLTGTSVTVSGNNSTATKETGEPNHAGNAGGKSLWWSWTAPSNGAVTLNTTGSNFDTLLAVYQGGAVGSLTSIVSNDDANGGTQSAVTFTAVAGQTYKFAVDGYAAASGNITLNLAQTVTRPANDNLAAAATLSGSSVTATGSSVDATKETSEPSHAGNTGGKSLWWSWTAPASGQVTLSTAGSNFDTLLAVYQGSAVGSLTSIASNDDANGVTQSQLVFTAVAGQIYRIAVDGYGGAAGNVTLNLAQASTRPANDDFVSAATLTGRSIAATGSNVGASKQAGEPNHAGNLGGKSVWWNWTAPSAGAVTLNTFGSNFNTLLAVYRGTAVNALTAVASNNDAAGTTQSQVTFTAVAGQVYRIAVDGAAGASGSIALNLSLVPANDAFSAARVISGSTVTITDSNVNATKQNGEPNHAGNVGGRSVWYRWTAPSTGAFTIDTSGSSYDTLLGVYSGNTISRLTTIASNDDNGTSFQSRVSFNAVSGRLYYIAVDGYNGARGDITLNVQPGAVPAASVSRSSSSSTSTSSQSSAASMASTRTPPLVVAVNKPTSNRSTSSPSLTTSTGSARTSTVPTSLVDGVFANFGIDQLR